MLRVGNINLPTSKSISNRVLLIRALAYSFQPIENLSEAEDTVLLEKALNSNTNRFYTGDGGTTFRFLLAFLSKIVGEWHIDCSEQMKKRPIKILVDALNALGGQVTYTEKEGYPPVRVLGSNLHKHQLKMSGSVSSQYITALLLIAPTLPNGLELELEEKIVSKPYITMTLEVLKTFGVASVFEGNIIKIAAQDYKMQPFCVESDWSGASYFYEALCLADEGELFLQGLQQNSLQGDAKQVGLWEQLGIHTTFEKGGVRITKQPCELNKLTFDFTDMPDLTQTFAVTCCMKGIPFVFSGLETLKIKETNRITALIMELGKLGFNLYEPQEGSLAWDGKRTEIPKETVNISTYNDHRMAMAFAPITLRENIVIENPEVVKKSFPKFWEEWKKIVC